MDVADVAQLLSPIQDHTNALSEAVGELVHHVTKCATGSRFAVRIHVVEPVERQTDRMSV